ncbi:hypothetical protein ACFL1H_04675, partial [Nanoarchaeota archaeon]
MEGKYKTNIIKSLGLPLLAGFLLGGCTTNEVEEQPESTTEIIFPENKFLITDESLEFNTLYNEIRPKINIPDNDLDFIDFSTCNYNEKNFIKKTAYVKHFSQEEIHKFEDLRLEIEKIDEIVTLKLNEAVEYYNSFSVEELLDIKMKSIDSLYYKDGDLYKIDHYLKNRKNNSDLELFYKLQCKNDLEKDNCDNFAKQRIKLMPYNAKFDLINEIVENIDNPTIVDFIK